MGIYDLPKTGKVLHHQTVEQHLGMGRSGTNVVKRLKTVREMQFGGVDSRSGVL